jgi:hypothetical protein
MANRRTESNRINTGRSKFASFLLVLLPGFMFLGLLAPAAVTVEYEGEEETVLPLAFRNFQLPTRRPMIGTRSTVDAASTELAAIRDALLKGTRMFAGRAKEALDLANFEVQGDKRIVLDEDAAEEDVVNSLFDSSSGSGGILAVDLTPLWNESRFDIIPAPLRTWGDRPDDDFAGDALVFRSPVPQPVEIPEPQSAALVVLGLVGLALRRSRD